MNYSYSVSNSAATSGMGFLAGVTITMWIIFGIAIYIYYALSLSTLAEKTGKKDKWWAWIPILNIFLMLRIAKKDWWWFFLLLITPINVVFNVLVWMAIAEAVKKPNWWGILMIVPGVNLIVPGYLAFSKK